MDVRPQVLGRFKGKVLGPYMVEVPGSPFVYSNPTAHTSRGPIRYRQTICIMYICRYWHRTTKFNHQQQNNKTKKTSHTLLLFVSTTREKGEKAKRASVPLRGKRVATVTGTGRDDNEEEPAPSIAPTQ
eukprot:scaffold11399_cov153-Amphora_coffeaeformis.AAC.1